MAVKISNPALGYQSLSFHPRNLESFIRSVKDGNLKRDAHKRYGSLYYISIIYGYLKIRDALRITNESP